MNFNNPFNTVVVNQGIVYGVQLYDTGVDSEGDVCEEELEDFGIYTKAAKTYEEQREPIVGDLLIYRSDVPNSKGQKDVLSRITGIEKNGMVYATPICFLQGEGTGGGGTTLNKYTFTISSSTVEQTAANRARVYRIFEQAKGRVMAQGTVNTDTAITGGINSNGYLYLSATSVYYYSTNDEYTTTIASEYIKSDGTQYRKYQTRIEPDGTITHRTAGIFGSRINITYWNDVEIT